jgi:hypothetical protein
MEKTEQTRSGLDRVNWTNTKLTGLKYYRRNNIRIFISKGAVIFIVNFLRDNSIYFGLSMYLHEYRIEHRTPR